MKEENILNRVLVGLLLMMIATDIIFAGGLGGITTIAKDFAKELIVLGATIIIIAIIWAGFKVAFGAGWADVSNVVMGALIIGGAPLIAGILFKGTGTAIA